MLPLMPAYCHGFTAPYAASQLLLMLLIRLLLLSQLR